DSCLLLLHGWRVRAEKRRSIDGDLELDDLRIHRVLRRLGYGCARRVGGEKDREHAEQEVGPEPTYECEGDRPAEAAHLALRPLPARDRFRGTGEGARGVAQLADRRLHAEELLLALHRALVHSPPLGGRTS